MSAVMQIVRSQFDTPERLLALVVALSIVAHHLCVKGISRVMPVLFARGIFGIDINKTTAAQRQAFGAMKRSGEWTDEALKKRVVPESLGIVVGGIFLCTVALIMVCTDLIPLSQFNAAVSSIAVMLLLGFVDDVLDVRWRYKIVLSFFGTLPLLLSYDGSTSIVVPIPLRELLGTRILPLGSLYILYMAALCVFCTNSINILAGVNGVEVGQSIVIALACIVHNLIHLYPSASSSASSTSRNAADEIAPFRGSAFSTPHLLSLLLLVPFVACSLALWIFNRYPSRVFVGDSYTYFAGIVLAVAGIAGGYSKTLLLFFIPQIINFIMSLPQLFHIVHCPRHRVPTWDASRDVLVNSRNYTILNFFLLCFGDMHERALTNLVLAFQAVCCACGFLIRYHLAALVFEVVE